MIVIELLIFLSTILPLFHIINSLISLRKQKKYLDREEKRMSILIPCYNETDTVKISIKGLLNMNYDSFEAIYINDGSDDDTFEKLSSLLSLQRIDAANDFKINETRQLSTFCKRIQNLRIKGVYKSKVFSNFYVIDKVNDGKSSALNAGILFAHSDIVVTLDADSVLEKNALKIMNCEFYDNTVVAAGGSIHIMQGYDKDYLCGRFDKKRSLLVNLQIMEYMKGFYVYKKSLAKQNATAIISGAFGVFTRDILMQAGGFRKTLGEDIDITLCIQRMIHKTDKRIVYITDAMCYTQCPENLHDLTRQRLRWQKGFVNCVFHYKKFLFKTLFIKSLSFHFLFEAMIVGISSCLFTVFMYVFVTAMAFSDISTLKLFGIYYGFGVVFNIGYSISALILSAKKHKYPKAAYKKVALAIVLDIFFYRYFNLLMYIGGTASSMWNRGESSWNKVERNKREFNLTVDLG